MIDDRDIAKAMHRKLKANYREKHNVTNKQIHYEIKTDIENEAYRETWNLIEWLVDKYLQEKSGRQ